MTTAASKNGINVDQLHGMIDAVTEEPGLARATSRTSTSWHEGFCSEAQVGDYVQGGRTVERGRSFNVGADHPEGLLGGNRAPAAVETLVAAVAGCIAGGWATFGAALDIPVEELSIDLEGDIDPQRFMGLGEGGRPGLERIWGWCE